jgi:hypothetical protein
MWSERITSAGRDSFFVHVKKHVFMGKHATLLSTLQKELDGAQNAALARTLRPETRRPQTSRAPTIPRMDLLSWLGGAVAALAGGGAEAKASAHQQATRHARTTAPSPTIDASTTELQAGRAEEAGEQRRLLQLLDKVQNNKLTLLHQTNMHAIDGVARLLRGGAATSESLDTQLRAELAQFKKLEGGWVARSREAEQAQSKDARRLLARMSRHWNAQAPRFKASAQVPLSQAMYGALVDPAPPRENPLAGQPAFAAYVRLQAGAGKLYEESKNTFEKLRALHSKKEALWLQGGGTPASLAAVREAETQYDQLHASAIAMISTRQELDRRVIASVAAVRPPQRLCGGGNGGGGAGGGGGGGGGAGGVGGDWNRVLKRVAALENQVMSAGAVGFRLREAVRNAVSAPVALLGGMARARRAKQDANMRQQVATFLAAETESLNRGLQAYQADGAVIKARLRAKYPRALNGGFGKRAASQWNQKLRRNEQAEYRHALAQLWPAHA